MEKAVTGSIPGPGLRIRVSLEKKKTTTMWTGDS